MQIKLIVIDIDGTLIRSDLSVGERTISAISNAQKMGIRTTFATGRMVSASAKYAEMLSIELPLVALNGAIVQNYNDGVPLFHKKIPQNIFFKFLPIIEKSESVVTIVFGDEAFGWNIDDSMRKRLSSWIVDITEISPNEIGSEPTIVMVAGDEKPVRNTAEKIMALEIENIQFFLFPSIRYYPMWYMEIRADRVDKGLGVKALREKLGLTRENILVIGDYVNDLPMFAEAGISAAVANAHQEVLHSADYVSPLSCDQDAVGEIIEKMVLE